MPMTSRVREPARDAVVIGLYNHGVLLLTCALGVSTVSALGYGVLLSFGLTVGTLTVLHDAGHRMFGRKELPNVLAVQLSTPAGLWVGHWTLKHRVHHKMSQVYPVDEATRSSALVRLHPAAPHKPWQRWQHQYAWFAYGLAWLGEVRSQLRYLRDGEIPGTKTPDRRRRTRSFVLEKGLNLAVLAPYAWGLGVGHLAVILVIAETMTCVLAAIALTVGHINEGLEPTADELGGSWTEHLVRTTASFSPDSRLMSFLTGGLTLHLAHHLRPLALRSELPELQRTVVADAVAASGVKETIYPGLWPAVRGHWRRLRRLGQSDADIPRQALQLSVSALR
jgi:linoleoyl-CoA desaturase